MLVRSLAALGVVAIFGAACSAAAVSGVPRDGGNGGHTDASTRQDARDAHAEASVVVEAGKARDAGSDAGAAHEGDASDASEAAMPGDASLACDSAVTWAEIWGGIFGPSGTSSCTGVQCHTNVQAGFLCGTTAVVCYHGMVAAGLVTPGVAAPSSVLIDPQVSPLCGVSPSGDMPELPPPLGVCVTDAQVAEIAGWLSCGAVMN
jgi:hypothetical protein